MVWCVVHAIIGLIITIANEESTDRNWKEILEMSESNDHSVRFHEWRTREDELTCRNLLTTKTMQTI